MLQQNAKSTQNSPNETPSTALGVITHAKKHVTFSTPLHGYIHKWTHSKCQHNYQQLKPAIKLHSFQDHHFEEFSSKNKSFQDHLPPETTYLQHSSKNNHSMQNTPIHDYSSQNSHFRTIFHQSVIPGPFFTKLIISGLFHNR